MSQSLRVAIAELQQALGLVRQAQVAIGAMPFSGAVARQVQDGLQAAVAGLEYLVGDAPAAGGPTA